MRRRTSERKEPGDIRRQAHMADRRGGGYSIQHEIMPVEGLSDQDSRSQTAPMPSSQSSVSGPRNTRGASVWFISGALRFALDYAISGIQTLGMNDIGWWQPIANFSSVLAEIHLELSNVMRCMWNSRSQECSVEVVESVSEEVEEEEENENERERENEKEVGSMDLEELSDRPLASLDPLDTLRDGNPHEWLDSGGTCGFLEQCLGPKIPLARLTICSGPPVRDGTGGSIFAAYWGGTRVAVRVSHPRANQPKREYLEAFAKNVSLLMGIKHPNFVRVFGWCLIERGGGTHGMGACEPAMVMESSAVGGSLASLMTRSPRDHQFSRMSWRHVVEVARDYTEAIMHLHGNCQILLGAFDPGNFVVQSARNNDGGNTFKGKIIDLSGSRLISSRDPPSHEMQVTRSGQSRESFSILTDMHNFSNVLWALLVAQQPYSKAGCWNLPSGDKLASGFSAGFSQRFKAKESSKVPGALGVNPPGEFLDLVQKAGQNPTKKQPSFAELREALEQILSAMPQQLQLDVSGKVMMAGPSERSGIARQLVLESSEPGSRKQSGRNKRKQKKKKQRGFPRWIACSLMNCCKCISLQADRSSPTEELSEPVGRFLHDPPSSYYGVATHDLLDDAEILPVSSRSEVLHETIFPVHGITNEAFVVSRWPMPSSRWGVAQTAFRKIVMSRGEANLTLAWVGLIQFMERIQVEPGLVEWGEFLRLFFEVPELQESDPEMWGELRLRLVNYLSLIDLVPGTGFGISAKKLDHIAKAALGLNNYSFRSEGRRRSWVFELGGVGTSTNEKTMGKLLTKRGREASSTHTAMVTIGLKRYVVTYLEGTDFLGDAVKRSEKVGCMLKKRVGQLLPEKESEVDDIEEIVDALKWIKTDQVLAWLVDTEVAKLYYNLPGVCSFKGVCHDPLALLSEQIEGQSVYDLLRNQKNEGEGGLRWKWMDRLIVARKIAKGLGAFHANGVTHGMLTSRSIIVNSHLDVKIELPPLRFVDGSLPGDDAQWMSPEKWKGRLMGPKSDIYSLGIILWELISDCEPWEGFPPSEIVVAVCEGHWPAIEEGWDMGYVALMKRCWEMDAENRPSSSEVFDLLTEVQEGARELVSLSSGSEGSALEKVRLGLHYDSRYMKSWSSQGSVHRTVTVGSTPSQSDPELRSPEENGRSTSLDMIKGEDSDILKVLMRGLSGSKLPRISVASKDGRSTKIKEVSTKLQDKSVVNELVIIGNLPRAPEKLCQNQFSGVLYTIERMKQWLMPQPWSWKAEILGFWMALETMPLMCILKRNLFLPKAVKHLCTEIAVLKKMRHPNIVAIHEVIEDGANGMLLVSEFVKGEPLLDTSVPIEPVNEGAACDYMRDILKGLDYLHSNHVVHGDLRPNNLMITEEGNVKIKMGSCATYWGASPMDKRHNYCDFTHTRDKSFAAPESLDGIRNSFLSRAKADVYSLGVCLHLFVCGCLPHEYAKTKMGAGTTKAETPTLVGSREGGLSPALADLLARILNKDPRQRITLNEIMGHQWIKGGRGALLPSSVLFRVPLEVTQVDRRDAVSLNVARLFADLPLIQTTSKHYRKGDKVLERGRKMRGLLVVEDGHCRGVVDGSTESASNLAFPPGSVLGFEGFLTKEGAVPGTSVIATKPTIVNHVTRKERHHRSTAAMLVGLGVAVACDLGATIAVYSCLIVSCLIVVLFLPARWWLDRAAATRLEKTVNKVRRFGPAAGEPSADVFR